MTQLNLEPLELYTDTLHQCIIMNQNQGPLELCTDA